jgi:hypothetical protein
MELRDPVVVYDAATNVEAQVVKMALNDAGIDAFAMEDLSTAGLWMFGILPEIHKPQVWVSATDLDLGQAVLKAYESRVAQREKKNDSATGPAIEVLCEECQQKSFFSWTQQGKVEECPHCGAYVDVEAIDGGDPSA